MAIQYQKEIESLTYSMQAELTKLGIKSNFDIRLQELWNKINSKFNYSTNIEKPNISFEDNSSVLALTSAMRNADAAIEFVSENFEEFAYLRKNHEEEILIHFLWFEIAVLITKERFNGENNDSEFANQLYRAGLVFFENENPKKIVFI